MSVSVSRIGIGRSLDRSIDQSQFPGQFLDQSICVCRCLYKEQHPPTRSHFCRKILRLVDLFSISSFHPLNLSRAHTTCSPSRDTESILRAIVPRGLPYRFSNSSSRSGSSTRILGHAGEFMLDERKVATEKSAHEMRRSTMKKAEKVGSERRTMHRRPTWVPRTKLTRYVNCLSNLSRPPILLSLCIYTDI